MCTLISPNCNSFIQFCHNSENKRLLLFLILSVKFIPTLLREAININKTTLTKLRHHKINLNFPSSETVKFRFSPTKTNSVDYGMLKLFLPIGRLLYGLKKDFPYQCGLSANFPYQNPILLLSTSFKIAEILQKLSPT